ncbi:hypothetical protein MMC18_001155 [Xylographa bjoerkii]|nr:hypothetical protein [Xylographa bjoerkii]
MTLDSTSSRFLNHLLLLVLVYGIAPLFASQSNSLLSSPVSAEPSQFWDGYDGLWSTCMVQIGNPAQNVRVHVSTSTSVRRLPEDRDAPTRWESAGCYDVFDSDAANRLLHEGSFSSGSKNAQFGSDHVTLELHEEGGFILKLEDVTSFTTSYDHIGSLGLAPWIFDYTGLTMPQPSTMHHFLAEHNNLSASYGYTAGALYKEEPVYGSLALGCYDTTRIGATSLTVDLCPVMPQDLLVSIESITTGNESLLVKPIVANIDTSVAQIWLPVTACQRFEEVFDLTWNEEYNLYLVNKTLHEALLRRNATITFTLSSSTSDPNSTIDIDLPYASFDLVANYPLVANAATHYFPIRRAGNGSQYILGRTFLQEAYLLVDHDRSRFSISKALFPDPQESQSIVPIYPRPNVVAMSRRFEHHMHSSIACVMGAGIALLTIPLLYYFDLSAVLCETQRRPPAEEDVFTDSSIIFRRNASYSTKQYFRQEMQILEATVSQLVYLNLLPDTILLEVSALLSEMESVPPSQISIFSKYRSGTLNQLKLCIEELTGVEWEWWPLHPREKPLLQGYSRVRWSCACGEEISRDILSAVANRLGEIAFPQRSNIGITPGASDERPAGQQDASFGSATPSSSLSGIPNSFITGFDASAPSSLGYTYTVGANVFEKFSDREFALLCAEIPDPTNDDYHYPPKPVTHNPPISPHEFRSRFSNSRKRRSSSKASISHYIHHCKIPCRPSQEAVARIPKKVFPLEEEGHGHEYFWGIHAVERISFLVVMIYHTLLLLPPLVFWFLWLFAWVHEGDIQNAAIPFMAAVTMMAVVWGVWITTNNNSGYPHVLQR